jgi:two-component system, OmpR family, response regulator
LANHYRPTTERHEWGAMPGSAAKGSTLVTFPKPVRADSIFSTSGNLGTKHDSRPVRILVVDDDPILLDMVSSYLEGQGMHVASASGPQEAVRQIVTSEPDLIMLDLRLGQDNGLDLLREIRSRHDIPVIITSGDACTEIDRVVGLELGADDYVTKPIGLRELLARVRAILRRRETVRKEPRQDSERGRYRFGGWQLDRRVRRLTAPDGEQVALTKGEYTLLTVFLDAPQRPLTREHLLQATRVHEDIFDRSIDVQVLRLRRKLEIDPSAPRVIRTERGVGYLFDLPVERHDSGINRRSA